MPEEAAAAGGNANFKNTVHEDQIFRSLIKTEQEWARNWEKKWGFMKDAYGKKQSTEKNQVEVQTTVTPFASGLPTKCNYLVDECTYKFQNMCEPGTGEMSTEQKKSYYLLAHQTKKLQLVAGTPIDKYKFPATRSQEIGWWVSTEKKQAETNPSNTSNMPNTLVDAKIGRWARGQGDVYAWWGR